MSDPEVPEVEADLETFKEIYPEFLLEVSSARVYSDTVMQKWLDKMETIYHDIAYGIMAGAAHLMWVDKHDNGPDKKPDEGRGTMMSFEAEGLKVVQTTQATGNAFYAFWGRTKYGREFIEYYKSTCRRNRTIAV